MAGTREQSEDVVPKQRYPFIPPWRRVIFDQPDPPYWPGPLGLSAFETIHELLNQFNLVFKSSARKTGKSIHALSWEDEIKALQESTSAAFNAANNEVSAALEEEKKNIRFSLEETHKTYPTSNQVNKNRRQKNGHRTTRSSTVHRSS